MKFVYLTDIYPSYVTAFYARRSGLADQPYATQLAALAADAFAWNGAWEPALAPLGYEIREVFLNVEPLQRAWAKEQGVPWAPTQWRTEVPLLQLKPFQAEILFIDAPLSFDRSWLDRLRQNCPSLRLVLGFSGSAAYDLDTLRACDAVLTCTRSYADFFRMEGCRAFYLRHAFNPAVLARLPARGEPGLQVSFVGNVVRVMGYHLERAQLLEALIEAIPLSLHCPQSEISLWGDLVETTARRGVYVLMQMVKGLGVSQTVLRRLPRIGQAALWTTLPLRQINPRLKPYLKPAVYGLEMCHVLQRSAVALNKHIDAAGSEAGNCRLFEATGVGTCLLTDWKTNLAELFEPDVEVVAYRSAEECIEKARWLLDHRAEREAIAKAGQARTLREHTFAHRAQELDSIIKELLKLTGSVQSCYG